MATKVKPSRLQITGTPQSGDVPVYVDADTFQWGSGGDVKVFTTSQAQAALDWYLAGRTPLFYSDTGIYFPTTSTSTQINFQGYQCRSLSDNTVDSFIQKELILYYSGTTAGVVAQYSPIISKILDTDTDYSVPYTPQYNGSPATKKYVDDTAGGKVSDTVYGSGWDGVTGVAPSQNAVYDKINSIDGLIPSAATSSNKLTDKNYVDDSINSVTAYYITKNAQSDQWATRAELFAATTFYSGGVARVPTKNDYTIVLADEQHDNATTRYIYNSGWEYQYTVNETALTQAQLDALNSGITSGKVSTYDGYASTISGKQDALTLPATPTQGNLVTRGADNETLVDGGAIPTGVPSGGTDGQVLSKVSGNIAWANAPAETVVSGDSGTTYTIKVANSDPSGESNTTITFVL